MALILRGARPSDAPSLTALFLAARAAAMPWLPVLHGEAATLAWMQTVVLRDASVTVAEDEGKPAGFAAWADGFLHHLYVAPAAQGRGVGRRLLDAAKAQNSGGLRLLVFQRNARARRVYEAAGFQLLGLRDGAANAEREPDALYGWTP